MSNATRNNANRYDSFNESDSREIRRETLKKGKVTSGKKNPPPAKKKKKGHGCLTALIVFVVIVAVILTGGYFVGDYFAKQYLNAGKVKGAKTVEDVKRYYESRVPMNRGCRVPDVARAILYIMEQEYETGQAVPVTGGQEMLK